MPGSRYHRCRTHELSIPQAFIIALLIESLFTVAALRYIDQQRPVPTPRPVPFTVTLTPLPPPATPQKPKPAPAPVRPPPKTVYHHRPVPSSKETPAPPRTVPRRPHGAEHNIRPKPKVKPPLHPSPSQPRSASLPPKAVARTPAVPHKMSLVSVAKSPARALARITVTFKDAVRGAVKDVVRYPRTAQVMGLEGTAEVAFEYFDGRADHVRMIHTSGSAALDQAALKAVCQAHLPAPPAALRGRVLKFRIRLRFQFDGSE